jgi:ribosomal protein L21
MTTIVQLLPPASPVYTNRNLLIENIANAIGNNISFGLVVKVAVAAVVAVGAMGVTPVSAAATVHNHGRCAIAVVGGGRPVPSVASLVKR